MVSPSASPAVTQTPQPDITVSPSNQPKLTGIDMVTVSGGHTIQFSLTQPVSLTREQVSVTCIDSYGEKQPLTYYSLLTNDQIHYKINMNDALAYASNIQVEIPELPGEKKMQATYLYTIASEDYYVDGRVGEAISRNDKQPTYFDVNGSINYTERIIGGELPAGITFNSSTGYYEGRFEKATEDDVVTIREITDHYGRKIQQKIHWLIGDYTNLRVYQIPHPLYQGMYSASYNNSVYSGSGNYRFELVEPLEDPGLRFYSSGDGFYIQGYPKNLGKFQYSVKVTDLLQQSKSKVFTVDYEVKKPVRVECTLRYPDNYICSSMSVEFKCLSDYFYDMTTNASNYNGRYVANLVPGLYAVTYKDVLTGVVCEGGEMWITEDMKIEDVIPRRKGPEWKIEWPESISTTHSYYSVSFTNNDTNTTMGTGDLGCSTKQNQFIVDGNYDIKVTLKAYNKYNAFLGTYTLNKTIVIENSSDITVTKDEWNVPVSENKTNVLFDLEVPEGCTVRDQSVQYVYYYDNTNMETETGWTTFNLTKEYDNRDYAFYIQLSMTNGKVYWVKKKVSLTGGDQIIKVTADEWK